MQHRCEKRILQWFSETTQRQSQKYISRGLRSYFNGVSTNNRRRFILALIPSIDQWREKASEDLRRRRHRTTERRNKQPLMSARVWPRRFILSDDVFDARISSLRAPRRTCSAHGLLQRLEWDRNGQEQRHGTIHHENRPSRRTISLSISGSIKDESRADDRCCRSICHWSGQRWK